MRRLAFLISLCCVSGAVAQSTAPAVFVANNGNLEGSVSSLLLNEDGSLTFHDKLVLGTIPDLTEFDPGTNATCISISTDGRWLAVGHATSSQTVERISILEVEPDATLSLAMTFSTPDSPLDVQWIEDGVLAVTRTSLAGFNEVRAYAVDPEEGSSSLLGSVVTGAFTTSLALHPGGGWLYAQDSLGTSVTAMAIQPDGTLTLLETLDTPGYPLGLGVSADGRWLYAGGGISMGGKAILGFEIDGSTGTLTPLESSPFTSPGSSPKQVATSSDAAFAYAAHGSDATIRGFSIDSESGALTDLGVSFDVGVQGSLGEIAVDGDLLFATDRDTILDGVRGVYSFTISPEGDLVQNGPLVDTQGSTPNALAIWRPRPLFGDLTLDGVVDGADLGALLAAWGSDDAQADLDEDGIVDGADLGLLLGAWTKAAPGE